MIKIINPKTIGFEDFKPDHEEDDDDMGVRFVEAEGLKFTIRFKDPYGHAFIQASKGRTPEELSGAYTTEGQARHAIEKYINKMKKDGK